MRRFTCLLLLSLLATTAVGAEPLHLRIDGLLAQGGIGDAAPICDDATFVRRVYLDLAGLIPTADQARAFLNDKNPAKRAALIDRLIASERFNRRLVNLYDVTMMERRADKNVKTPEWRAYLLESVRNDKPFNVLAQEILGADGVDAKLRPAAKFFLDRDCEPTLMTRDVGRVFFGMDLQCAQCHDHPLVEDYYQRDFYGIYAFVSRSYVFDDKKAKKKVLAEKPEGDVDFKSVFTEQSGFTQPRLPGGAAIVEPVFALGDEYQVKPAKDVRPVPKFSRRSQLARLAGTGNNKAFNRNIANRLWAFVMGRGIVEPVDFHHTDNPPTNPELLDLLTVEIQSMGFNAREFVRQLALTRAYQRSLTPPTDLAKHKTAIQQLIAQVTSELAQREAKTKAAEVAYLEAVEKVAESRAEMLPIREQRDKFKKAWSAAQTKLQAAAKPIADSTKKRDAAKKLVDAIKPAAAAAKVASASLTEDKELAQVAAALKAREAKQSAALASLEKTLASQLAAQKTAKTAVDAAAAKVAEVRGQLKILDEKSRRVEKDLIASESPRRQLVLAQKQGHAKLKTAKSYLQLLETQERIAQLAQQAKQTQEALTVLLAQQVQMKEQHAAGAAAQVKAKAAYESAVAKSNELLTKLKGAQEAATAASEVAAKAQAAIQSASDPKRIEESKKLTAQRDELIKVAAALEVESKTQATATKQLQENLAQAEKTVNQLAASLKSTTPKVDGLQKQRQVAESELLAKRQSLGEVDRELLDAWTKQFAVADLKPLTPEQVAWSLMQVGGLIERQAVASKAAIEKKTPLDESAKKDASKVAARQREVDSAAYDKLAGNVGAFVKLFGGGAGQPQGEFFATVDQALFMSNGSQLRSWLTPSGNNASARLTKLQDPKAFADELYLSFLTRYPDDVERQQVNNYLKTREKDRPAAIQELGWALATSIEFRFNH